MRVAAKPPPSTQISALLGLTASAIAGGAVIGASTNAINGAVSPTYFRNIMQWQNVESIWRASIAQGVFEGVLYGVLFSLVFTSVVSLVSGVRCSFNLALRYLLAIIATIYCCWIVGGLMAMALATLSPEFYRNTFLGVPDTLGEMLCYAWVGGSIWGALFGGVMGCIIGSAMFVAQSRRAPSEPVA